MLNNITTDTNDKLLENNEHNSEEMTPIKLEQTETETPKTKKYSGKRLLKQLECDLSPKFIRCNRSSDGKRSRYGRQQKQKQTHDFLSIEIACSLQKIKTQNKKNNKIIKATPTKLVRRSIIDDLITVLPSKILAITPLDINASPSKTNVIFESPIEKLINKNRKLASLMMTPNKKSLNDSDHNMNLLFNVVSHSKIESDITRLDNSKNNLVNNSKINYNSKKTSDNSNTGPEIVTTNNALPLLMTNNTNNKIIISGTTNENIKEVIQFSITNKSNTEEETPLAETIDSVTEVIPLPMINFTNNEGMLLATTIGNVHKGIPFSIANDSNTEEIPLASTIDNISEIIPSSIANNSNTEEETPLAETIDSVTEVIPLPMINCTNNEGMLLATTISNVHKGIPFSIANDSNTEEIPLASTIDNISEIIPSSIANNSNTEEETPLAETIDSVTEVISLPMINCTNNEGMLSATTIGSVHKVIPFSIVNDSNTEEISLASTIDNISEIIPFSIANNSNTEEMPLASTIDNFNKVISFSIANNNNNTEELNSTIDSVTQVIPLPNTNSANNKRMLLAATIDNINKIIPFSIANNSNTKETPLAETINSFTEVIPQLMTNSTNNEVIPLTTTNNANNNYEGTNIDSNKEVIPLSMTNETVPFTKIIENNKEVIPLTITNYTNNEEIPLTTIIDNNEEVISLSIFNSNNSAGIPLATTIDNINDLIPLTLNNNEIIPISSIYDTNNKGIPITSTVDTQTIPLIMSINDRSNEIIPLTTVIDNHNEDVIMANDDNIMTLNPLHIKESNNIIDTKTKSPSPSSTDSAKGSSIDIELDILFQVGELYWGKMGSYPYWPCMVSPSPQNSIINQAKRQVHVKFFADNGRRCWINKSSLLVFNGYDDYYQKYILPSEHVKSKVKKQYQCLMNYKFKWELAINEAESLIDASIERREELFNEILIKNREMKKLKSRKKSERLQSIRSSFDSLFNEHDVKFNSTEILNNKFIAKGTEVENHSTLKRARSPSLDVELIEDDNIPAKKIHLSNDEINYNLSPKYILKKPLRQYTNKRLLTKSNEQNNNNLNKLENNVEFKNFFNYIKTTILSNGNEKSIRELKTYTEKLWALRPTNNSNNIENATGTKPKDVEPINNKNNKNEENKDSIMDLISPRLDRFYLFKGLQKANVCRLCYKKKNLLKCKGPCSGWYHQNCINIQNNNISVDDDDDDDLPLAKIKELYKLNNNNNKIHYHVTGDSSTIDMPEQNIPTSGRNDNEDTVINKFLCNDCLFNIKPVCFVCKGNTVKIGDIENSNRIRCNALTCGRYFHLNCLKLWPQTKISSSNDSLLCPSHVCHTCVSDDPKGKKFFEKTGTLINCVKCPSSYHYDSHCIPAGTEFLTANNIICPKHTLDNKTINVNWCFICTDGGSLMCCDTCPIAMHVECLGIKGSPEGTYICEECETGRLPLYGEIVWAKLGTYRWWPAIIVPPILIPHKIVKMQVNVSDFCVRFLGTTRFSYAWLNRTRVFLYQEGDWGRCPPHGHLNKLYKNALQDAKQMYELIKKENQLYLNNNKIRNENNIKPIPYIKIKANRFVYPLKFNIDFDVNEVTPCYCNPNDDEPCGLASECINRVLLIECNPSVCPAGNKCHNQMFEKRSYPSLELVRTDGRGWGLQTLESLKAGQFIIEYVGEVIDMVEFRRRLKERTEQREENYYFLTINNNSLIDAGSKGNVARFINHSCQPNCETQKWTVKGHTRIGLFALVDIPPNTELTFNYNLENVGDEMKKCNCGAELCAGFIGAKYNRTKETMKKPKFNLKLKPKGKRKIENKIKLLKNELVKHEMETETNNESNDENVKEN